MKTIRRPFLTARWSNLAIVTWEVPPALLEPHLPAGLELDRRGGATLAKSLAASNGTGTAQRTSMARPVISLS